jgi:hypothetical protein
MYKTLQIEIEDLVEYLKKEIWSEVVSLDIYGTSKEDAFLSGINEGIDRAYRVLADLNIKGYIIQERNK